MVLKQPAWGLNSPTLNPPPSRLQILHLTWAECWTTTLKQSAAENRLSKSMFWSIFVHFSQKIETEVETGSVQPADLQLSHILLGSVAWADLRCQRPPRQLVHLCCVSGGPEAYAQQWSRFLQFTLEIKQSLQAEFSSAVNFPSHSWHCCETTCRRPQAESYIQEVLH